MKTHDVQERGPSWQALLAFAVVLAVILVIFSHVTHIG